MDSTSVAASPLGNLVPVHLLSCQGMTWGLADRFARATSTPAPPREDNRGPT